MIPLNLDLFYSQGFTATLIDRDIANGLLWELQKQKYTQEDDLYTLDNESSVALADSWKGIVHPQCPEWDKKSPFNSAPAPFKDFWFDVAKNYFKFFTNIWGDFTQQTVMAHRYVKGDGMGWHYDVRDTTWFLNLLYLTEQEFTKEDGGYLGIGRCKVDHNGVPKTSEVQTLAEFVPVHGLLVTIDNTNPKILHRVEKMVSEKERFVLVGQFGYIENTLHKERKANEATL